MLCESRVVYLWILICSEIRVDLKYGIFFFFILERLRNQSAAIGFEDIQAIKDFYRMSLSNIAYVIEFINKNYGSLKNKRYFDSRQSNKILIPLLLQSYQDLKFDFRYILFQNIQQTQ